MGIRRRADDDCIDIGSLNRRDGIKRGLTTKMIGQVPGCGAIWVSNRDKLCLGISRHIGRMDFPNPSSTKNRNSQHIGKLRPILGLAARFAKYASMRRRRERW